ncbi:phage tail tape measure protein [Paeniglutamicibacter terrestris]|uniref:Phage tail tape measure protein n=1 Tax=Paeniglutamicibacter terrestris TaxID=2723403 RepID=A0ABX1G7F7_9MICC|nr:phage tail tape measure protein [Paeniglutamicibacter terrestris]NKG22203.1 phage tail tape measure protein [Paeniglutamicibacter terrestris]
MAIRTVKLVLDAKVDGLVNKLKTSKKATQDFGRDLESWRKKNEKNLDTLGDAAGKAGLGIAAGLGLAAKAAIDWESAWAGVTKTVDGTPEQMDALEGSLRGLAKTLPATHAEIAGVAEAAGQLGVAREDVADFTKTMIDLSETTNLSADEAATSMAQFMNVMGTSGDKVDELGSSLVALGNDGASTEKDIMSMATRLSGAGKLVGASEADVLALANAMSSVGIEAELGGGVMTRVMTRMYSDVQTGGEGLEELAKVAGVSSEEFSEAFKNDPVRAIDMMVKGLEGVKLSGGNVVDTMKDLGIKGTEEVGTLLRLAGAGDLLSESLDLGASSWEENSALAEEAQKRYETTEAKITIAWNNIKDAAIEAGGVLLPILANLAEGAAGLADWFGAIPKPIQTFLTILAGVAGTGLLATTALFNIAKKTAELSEAFSAIQGTGGRAHTAIGKVSKAISGAVIVGAALAAGKSIIEGINEAARSGQTDLEEYFNLLTTGGGAGVVSGLDLGEGNALSTGMLKDYANSLGDVTTEAAAAKRAIEYIGMAKLPGMDWVSRNLGMFTVRDMTNDAGKLEVAMGSLGRAFEMGEIDMAQQGFADMAEQLALTDEEVATLINNVPALKDSLMGIATEQGLQIDPDNELGLVDLALGRIKTSAPDAAGALDSVGSAAGAAGAGGETAAMGIEEAAQAAEDAQKKVDDFYDALVNIGAIAISEREALRGLEESFDAAAEAATKNGKTLDDTTEKGRANGRALDGVQSSTMAAMEAQRQAGGTMAELAATMSAGREEFIKTAISMGMGKTEAAALADSLNLIPGAVFTEFDSNVDDLGERIHDLADAIKATPDKSITIDDNSPEVRQAMEDLGYKVEELPDGRIKVTDNGTASATGKEIDAVAAKHRQAQILATANTYGAEVDLAHAARTRTALIKQRVVNGGSQVSTGPGGRGGQLDHWQGGRVGSYENGGRLPYTGLGRDMILGVGSDGRPTANVDDGEWVISEPKSEKYDTALGMINNDDPRIHHLADFAGGGRPGNSPRLSVPPSREVRQHAAQAQAAGPVNVYVTVDGAGDADRAVAGFRDELRKALGGVGVRVGI